MGNETRRRAILLKVTISHGNSAKHLHTKMYEELENVRKATAGGWNRPCRFEELGYALRGNAKDTFKLLVARNYPDPANKTKANYNGLWRAIATML